MYVTFENFVLSALEISKASCLLRHEGGVQQMVFCPEPSQQTFIRFSIFQYLMQKVPCRPWQFQRLSVFNDQKHNLHQGVLLRSLKQFVGHKVGQKKLFGTCLGFLKATSFNKIAHMQMSDMFDGSLQNTSHAS